MGIHYIKSDDLAQVRSTEAVEFFAMVGFGITSWARMESHIIRLAADLLDTNVDKAGVVFYSINNFHTWLSIIEDVFSLDRQLASTRKVWTPIAAKLRKLNDTRVRLAHNAVTSLDHNSPDVCLRPVSEDYRPKSRNRANLTIEEATKFVLDTRAVAQELDELRTLLNSRRMHL
jgi:hypothetical protein